MTEERFLKHCTNYGGETVDNINQIVKTVFTGEELYEFCQYVVKSELKTIINTIENSTIEDVSNVIKAIKQDYKIFNKSTFKI